MLSPGWFLRAVGMGWTKFILEMRDSKRPRDFDAEDALVCRKPGILQGAYI